MFSREEPRPAQSAAETETGTTGQRTRGTPAAARRARRDEWLAYLDARAASLRALRTGDVASAVEEAAESRRLHAAWRGYDYEPGPLPPTTAFRPLEPQLMGLSDPTAVQIELSMSAVGPDVDAVNHAKRLLGVTLTDDLAWPWFVEWRAWFAAQDRAPLMWDEGLLADEPRPSDEDARFRDRLRALSADEKVAIAYGGNAVELELLAEDRCLTPDETRAVAASLSARGLAAFPATRAGRLARAMTVSQLKGLAATKGLIVKGKKDAIVATLVGHVDDHELEQLAPGEFAELRSPPRTEWLSYRRALIQLWTHTMTMVRYKEREVASARDMRDVLGGFTILADDSCPFCRTKNGTTVPAKDLRPEALPPYHPGCRCATAPRAWD